MCLTRKEAGPVYTDGVTIRSATCSFARGNGSAPSLSERTHAALADALRARRSNRAVWTRQGRRSPPMRRPPPL